MAPDPADDTADLARRAAWALDRLAPYDQTLALAVSGGSDSTALLLLAAAWARDRGRSLVAATVDHGLRPEAGDEARRVARLCARHGIPHAVLCWRPPEGPVSMAAARRARHALLGAWAEERGAGQIALAHTADDRIETFLIRIRAGSDWWGLAAPMPSAPSPAWPEACAVRLLRPLLWAGRDTLRAWLRSQGEPWIEDPTNADARYERTRARQLRERLSPEARASLLRVLQRLARLRAAQTAAMRDLVAGSSAALETATLPAASWRAASPALRGRLLGYVLSAVAGSDAPIRADRLRGMADRLAAGPGPAATLAGAMVSEAGGCLKFCRAPPRRTDPPRPPRPATASAAARLSGLLADPHVEALAPPCRSDPA